MPKTSTAAPLHGRWLLAAQVTWLGVSLVTLALFAASVPNIYRDLSRVGSGAGDSIWSLRPDEAHALGQLGISASAYATFFVVIDLVFVLGFAAVAGLIFWRKSRDGMALFVSMFLMTFGTNTMSTVPVLPLLHPWYLAYKAVEDLVFLCFPLFFFLFPDGRLIPAWSRPAAWAWVVFGLTKRLWVSAPAWSGDVILAAALGVGLAAQVYRYRRVSTALQRQQTKWVVYGLALTFVVVLAVLMPFQVFPWLSQPGVPAFFFRVPALAVIPLSLLILPVTIGISILRYRLWDIDLIIRRTVIYGTLTVALALMYLAAVITLQSTFYALTGRDSSTLATVISTLGIAALFAPVRWRIQQGIDRRFFRRKYDTARMLAAFGHALRDEVELDRLSDNLLAIVQEAMQPAHESLWLRKPVHNGKAPL